MDFISIMKKLNSSAKFSKMLLIKTTKRTKLLEAKSEKVKFEMYSLSYFYIILLIGILSNILFLIIILKKKINVIKSSKNVKQPFLCLLIAIIIGDIFYLLSELNEWLLSNNIYNSINGVCQLLSYIFNYFLALHECHLITANIFIIHFLFLNEKKMILNNDRLSSSMTDQSIGGLKRKSSNHLHVRTTSIFESPKFSVVSSDPNSENRSSFSSIKRNTEFRLKRKRTRSEISIKNIQSELKTKNYSTLIFYEKVFMSFYSFIFMYMLSFFFWIQQVNIYKIPSNYNSEKIVIINISLCEANKIYLNFTNYYIIMFNFIRILVIIFTLVVSILYLKKYNNYFIDFLKNTFDVSSTVESKHKRIFFKTSSIDFYSPAAEIEFNLDASTQRNFQRHSLHIRFVQFYSIMAIFYSLFKIFRVIFQLIFYINVVRNNYSINFQAILNLATSNLLDKKLLPVDIKFQYHESIAHSMEIIAHSFKLFLYIFVSVHYRCFLKTNRK